MSSRQASASISKHIQVLAATTHSCKKVWFKQAIIAYLSHGKMLMKRMLDNVIWGKGRLHDCDYDVKQYTEINYNSPWISYTLKDTITITVSAASQKNSALLRGQTPVKQSCFPQDHENGQLAGPHAGGPHLPYITPGRCIFQKTFPENPQLHSSLALTKGQLIL